LEAKEFGSYLRELRKTKKLTIRQLDTYSGVSNSYISQMERGERGVPSPDILLKLSKPLGVEYAELMRVAGYITENTNTSPLNELVSANYNVGDPGTGEREQFIQQFLKDFNQLSEEAKKQIHELIKTWNKEH
jgi:transcriptional regulator with XRE-family HTH domain